MCWKIARGYHQRARQIDIDDLVQQARVGLLVGFGKCDEEKSNGGQPMTYAIRWAQDSVQRFVEDHRSDVRVPNRRQTDAGRRHAENKWPWALTRADSLDTPMGEDGDSLTLHQVLGAPDDTDERRDQVLFESVSSELVAKLDGRIGDVIARRFGLNGYEPQGLSQIARAYGLSRARIRQLESKGLAALRRYASETRRREIFGEDRANCETGGAP